MDSGNTRTQKEKHKSSGCCLNCFSGGESNISRSGTVSEQRGYRGSSDVHTVSDHHESFSRAFHPTDRLTSSTPAAYPTTKQPERTLERFPHIVNSSRSQSTQNQSNYEPRRDVQGRQHSENKQTSGASWKPQNQQQRIPSAIGVERHERPSVSTNAPRPNRTPPRAQTADLEARPSPQERAATRHSLDLLSSDKGKRSSNRTSEPKDHPFFAYHFEILPINERVRFVNDREFLDGTVVWTGLDKSQPPPPLVVLYLTKPLKGATDGIFEGQQLVKQLVPDRYLMLLLSEIQPMDRLLEGDFCNVVYGPEKRTKTYGFARNFKDTTYELHPVDTNYTEKPLSKFTRYPDCFLERVPNPVNNNELSERYPPVSFTDFDLFIGRNKGIQGKNNSCYLDTLLFSLFAFSDPLDEFIFGEDYNHDLNHLRYSIITPLRTSHFVSDQHVEHLRGRIARATGNSKFETHSRDIPECMEALFGKVLKVPSPLYVGSVGNLAFYPTFSIEAWCPDNILVPTYQQILNFSSIAMDYCFRETPKYFFLQLPRQQDRLSMVIPSLELEVNDLLSQSVKVCCSCSRNASLQFPHRFDSAGLPGTFLCKACAEKLGLSPDDGRSVPESRVPDGNEPDSKMLLSAVICIERSHFNCFVRCGNGTPSDRWVFFDSMSDQEELFDPFYGDKKVFNIPMVREVPDFHKLVDRAGLALKQSGNIDDFLRELHADHLTRLFTCAYLAIYNALDQP